MLKIPYSKSDYRTLVENNYFYQDRTMYIQSLEDLGSTYLLHTPQYFTHFLMPKSVILL